MPSSCGTSPVASAAGGGLVAQGLEQAFDVSDGRFQIVRGRVDERVQVGVGAGQVGIGNGQFLVEVEHLPAGFHLLRNVGGEGQQAANQALLVAQDLVDDVEVALAHLTAGRVHELHGQFGVRKFLAGGVHLVEHAEKALGDQLRQQRVRGLAQPNRARPWASTCW